MWFLKDHILVYIADWLLQNTILILIFNFATSCSCWQVPSPPKVILNSHLRRERKGDGFGFVSLIFAPGLSQQGPLANMTDKYAGRCESRRWDVMQVPTFIHILSLYIRPCTRKLWGTLDCCSLSHLHLVLHLYRYGKDVLIQSGGLMSSVYRLSDSRH